MRFEGALWGSERPFWSLSTQSQVWGGLASHGPLAAIRGLRAGNRHKFLLDTDILHFDNQMRRPCAETSRARRWRDPPETSARPRTGPQGDRSP